MGNAWSSCFNYIMNQAKEKLFYYVILSAHDAVTSQELDVGIALGTKSMHHGINLFINPPHCLQFSLYRLSHAVFM